VHRLPADSVVYGWIGELMKRIWQFWGRRRCPRILPESSQRSTVLILWGLCHTGGGAALYIKRIPCTQIVMRRQRILLNLFGIVYSCARQRFIHLVLKSKSWRSQNPLATKNKNVDAFALISKTSNTPPRRYVRAVVIPHCCRLHVCSRTRAIVSSASSVQSHFFSPNGR
jgi:hypothetical protein